MPLTRIVVRPKPVERKYAWLTVVDNAVTVPGDARTFNSYNQPSVNMTKRVVFRARSKGGSSGEPAHGVWTRDMSAPGNPLVTVLDRATAVPQPNNLETMFTEPPSFPRIDMWSDTVATRGNHQPVWEYLLGDGTETRAGNTGVYTNPFGPLVTGASLLGGVPDFSFFAVPDYALLKFDVFPGAPAATDGATIVFKGNYTNLDGGSRTGVYYRNLADAPISYGEAELSPAAGSAAPVVIADNDTAIPGSETKFGSTAPPSAVGRTAVFAGFDNEDAPTLGGIYSAPLTIARPELTPLIQIGSPVPGQTGAVFNKLGEGVSYDGRFVAFWGAWGTATRTLVLQCPTEGNKDRQAFCREHYPNGFGTEVPVNQGIFVTDTWAGTTRAVATAPADFDDFLYWNFSGHVPGMGDSEEVGEPARWRSAAFVAVSGLVDGSLDDPNYHTAFKARRGAVSGGVWVGSPQDGIYLRRGPARSALFAIAQAGMPGTDFDPLATFEGAALPVTEMGIERDGFRGNALTVNVSMGTEEAGWAGIYLTNLPNDEL